MFMGMQHVSRAPVWFTLPVVVLPAIALVAWLQTARFTQEPLTEALVKAAVSAEWNDGGDWQAVSLPRRACPVQQEACFDHIRIPFEWQGGAAGIFLPEFVGSIRVAVNGFEIVTVGSVLPPIAAMHHRPTYQRVPDDLLRSGANELQIVVTNIPGRFHRVRPVYVGPHTALRAFAQPLIWLVSDSVLLTLGVFASAALFAFLLYGVDRNAIYIWFVCLCLFALMRNLFFVVHAPGWETFRVTAYYLGSNLQMTAVAGLVGCLLHPHYGQRYVVLNAAIFVLVVVMLLMMAADPYLWGNIAPIASSAVFAVCSGFIMYGVVRYYRSQRSLNAAWIVALVFGSYVLTLNDVGPILVQGRNTMYPLAHLAPVLLVMAFLMYVVGEYHRTLVALQHAEDDKKFAVRRERQLIRRDLHDGLGGRIAGLVMLARRKSPELAPYLQESLQELRRTMDELDSADPQPLRATVEALREKLGHVLSDHALQEEWHIDVPVDLVLDADTRKALYFAFHELVHNVVRHAHARRVCFDVDLHEALVHVRVRDDGVGIGDASAALACARGLAGLQARLQAVRGWLEIDSGGPGTLVRFAVPVA